MWGDWLGVVAAKVGGRRLVWGGGVGLLPALVDVLAMVVLSL